MSDAMIYPRGSRDDIESGALFMPKLDADGLIPAIVSDADSGAVLMLAWMNADALAQTLATRYATFWSRSRGRLWTKGEASGNRLAVVEVLTDCDQDAILVRARVEGDRVACHTGRRSCFYRALDLTTPLAAPVRLKPAGN